MTKSSGPFHRIVLGALALSFALAAPAAAIRLIPFQGRVADGGGEPLQGVFRVTFAIYDTPTGGDTLYVESHEDVSVIGGQINVLLGSLVSLDDPNGDDNFADAVLFSEADGPRYLGIKVGEETNQEMVPRHELVPSFHARIADTTVDGGVDTEQLANGAVTIEKLDPSVLLPPGAIMPYAGRTAPPGWVLCDGTTYDGTLPEFVPLFNAIGTAFGGSGNNFQVPDLRGRFLRGVDAGAGVDPDFASRTGGEGESKIGSTQGFATIGLTGSGSTSTAGNHQHGNPTFLANVQGGIGPAGYVVSSSQNVTLTNAAGSHSHSVSVSVAAPAAAMSTEVRPANIAVNYICKL